MLTPLRQFTEPFFALYNKAPFWCLRMVRKTGVFQAALQIGNNELEVPPKIIERICNAAVVPYATQTGQT